MHRSPLIRKMYPPETGEGLIRDMAFKMNKLAAFSGFLNDHGYILIMLAIPISIVLCLLQYLIKTESILLLIASLIIFGIVLLILGVWALTIQQLRNFSYGIMGILGLLLLIWAGLLIFKPESPISTNTRIFFQTNRKTISANQIEISLDISPTQFLPGETGIISIQVENKSDYELILDSVMFESQKKFFEGFLVNYQSADPLSQNAKKN